MIAKHILWNFVPHHIWKIRRKYLRYKNVETKVTIGYSETITGTKCGYYYIYYKCYEKLHRLMFTNVSKIPGLHKNLFNVTKSLQNCFQVKSEAKSLILKKSTPDILTRNWTTPKEADFF